MLIRSQIRQARRASVLAATLCGAILPANAFDIAQITNPIGRLARVFDSQLVKTEDRVAWLENRVGTLAQHSEHPLKANLGFRGYRSKVGGPDPFVTLDLGADYPIEMVYLIPAQREFAEDTGIFPKRYTLEISKQADFGQRSVVFTTGNSPQLAPDGIPVPINAHDVGRYVRLTVQEGNPKGMLDLFGLSEIAVISGGDAVSLGASVTSGGALNSPGIWSASALTDGRTPLGMWENSVLEMGSTGDSVTVDAEDPKVSWTIDLGDAAALDRVVLFPYQPDRSLAHSISPEALSVQIQSADGSETEIAGEWSNAVPDASGLTPLVIPLGGKMAKAVRLTATRPFAMGEMKLQAFSEIEVWSHGKNLAQGKIVTRAHAGSTVNVASLTDKRTSQKQIIPVGIWLQQLYERGMIERELAMLRPVHRQLASESELNATWGSAVALGLTFLVPVFIVERRRLMSRDQIDNLRKRIASDLHDDIGSNLGSISLIARTARKDLVRLHGPEEIADDLGEVESIARESSLAMRDIVWLLERRQDSIGDLVQRMRETAGRLLREINYTLECESTKTASKLSLDAKRHLFLFYKEAVHNVLKHSQANKVTIRLWDHDDQLALEILDNGVGLPRNEKCSTSSVQKLEDRARVLEGNLHIASSQETGTRIRLFVKRAYLTANPSLA